MCHVEAFVLTEYLKWCSCTCARNCVKLHAAIYRLYGVRVDHIPAANRPLPYILWKIFAEEILRLLNCGTVFTNRSLPKAPHTHSAYSWLFYEGGFNTAVGSCGYFNLPHSSWVGPAFKLGIKNGRPFRVNIYVPACAYFT